MLAACQVATQVGWGVKSVGAGEMKTNIAVALWPTGPVGPSHNRILSSRRIKFRARRGRTMEPSLLVTAVTVSNCYYYYKAKLYQIVPN